MKKILNDVILKCQKCGSNKGTLIRTVKNVKTRETDTRSYYEDVEAIAFKCECGEILEFNKLIKNFGSMEKIRLS